MKITHIQKEINELKKKLDSNLHLEIPEYKEIVDQIAALNIRKSEIYSKHWDSVDSKRQEMRAKIKILEAQVKEVRDQKTLKIPKHIQDWFDDYDAGVSFSGSGPHIIWISSDEKWVIVTIGGGLAGQGAAMGTGAYYYSPTSHSLAKVNGGSYLRNNAYCTVEGRLNAEKKQALINSIDRAEEMIITLAKRYEH